jgi:hypothetical protein
MYGIAPISMHFNNSSQASSHIYIHTFIIRHFDDDDTQKGSLKTNETGNTDIQWQ